jgi:hypothetical protein
VLVQLLLGAALGLVKSPAFTLPFNVTMTLFLWQAAKAAADEASSDVSSAPDAYTLAAGDLHHIVFRSFGQVFFAGSTLSGFVIFLAVAVASPVSALAGAAAAALCSLYAVLSGTGAHLVPLGLAGYVQGERGERSEARAKQSQWQRHAIDYIYTSFSCAPTSSSFSARVKRATNKQHANDRRQRAGARSERARRKLILLRTSSSFSCARLALLSPTPHPSIARAGITAS